MQAIAQFLALGLNVVADDVIWKREWLLDALRIFTPYRAYFVGVFVSDEEGARREQQRGDRHEGWDRGSARYAHHYAIYGVSIDTTHQSPWECASEIVLALRRGLSPTAFEEMRRFLAGGEARAEGASGRGAEPVAVHPDSPWSMTLPAGAPTRSGRRPSSGRRPPRRGSSRPRCRAAPRTTRCRTRGRATSGGDRRRSVPG
jgi:chloramphenicol 3-O phosphotransferase